MEDPLQVEHVDFVSFFTQDIARAKEFYAQTLGLAIETEGPDDMEFRAGQVTLDIFNPASQGQPFAPSPAGLALRVQDVAAARAAGVLPRPRRKRTDAAPALCASLKPRGGVRAEEPREGRVLTQLRKGVHHL